MIRPIPGHEKRNNRLLKYSWKKISKTRLLVYIYVKSR